MLRLTPPPAVAAAPAPPRCRSLSSAAAAAAAALSIAFSVAVPSSFALPPPSAEVNRCDPVRLKAFASTRASFSAEASSGSLPKEAILDLRGCSFAGLKLEAEVFSGAQLDGADLHGADLTHTDWARASARGANFAGATLKDSNLFNVDLRGADVRGTNFANALLSGANFGKDEKGQWANMEGAELEGALLSSSDTRSLCLNPTIDVDGAIALGCR